MTPMQDRIVNSEAMLLSFMAENNMPFTAAPKIIDLAKALARDKKALDSLHMNDTTASYKTRLGLGLTIKDKLIKSLKEHHFRLNMDEATSENSLHVLTVLVSYYSHIQNKVVVSHLMSIELIKVDSASIFQCINKFLNENNIPWTNLVSVLTDSCNVMRGKKTGVETRLREKAPHLLDIDGDCCHHIHNAGKKISEAFEKLAEGVFRSIHSDFQWSSDFRDYLKELCAIMNVTYGMPDNYVATRWLSVFNVAKDLLRMLDVYTLFYINFVDDRNLYQCLVSDILRRMEISQESRDRIKALNAQIRKKQLTADGRARKSKIVDAIFYRRKYFLAIVHFYLAIFAQLQKYVLLFQRKEPMIHRLHDELVELLRHFMASCIRPSAIPTDEKELAQTDIDDTKIWLKDEQIFVGSITKKILSEMPKKDAVAFLEKSKQAYSACLKCLLKKLPIQNELLMCCSAIDPVVQTSRDDRLLTSLQRLSELVTNVLDDHEHDEYSQQCRKYILDQSIPQVKEGERIDEWWCKVFARPGYDCLAKIIKALLSCFHGPQVESSFSSMKNIMNCKTSRMNLPTFDAKQTIRYELASAEKSAVQYFQREDIVFSPVNKELTANMKKAHLRHTDEVRRAKEKEQAQKEKLKLKYESKIAKKKAKEAMELAQRKAHRAHMLLVLSEKKKREKAGKTVKKRSHSSSRTSETGTKRSKTTPKKESEVEHTKPKQLSPSQSARENRRKSASRNSTWRSRNPLLRQ